MKIAVNEIVEQEKIALKDEFVAKVQAEENEIRLKFENGQVFKVKISEQH